MPTIQFELKIRVETMLHFGAFFCGILAIVNGKYILSPFSSSQYSKAQLGVHQFGSKPEVNRKLFQKIWVYF